MNKDLDLDRRETGPPRDFYVVWERRGGLDYPARVTAGPVAESALNPFHGNLTGPYTEEKAYEILGRGEGV